MRPRRSGAHRVGLLSSLVMFSLLSMVFGSAARAQPLAATSNNPLAADYRLGAGDTVRISACQNPDLTLEARISEAGLVSHPLLGNVKIGCMSVSVSVSAAESLISEGLRSRNFVRTRRVSLLVTQVRGNQASVLSQVNRPGRFSSERAPITYIYGEVQRPGPMRLEHGLTVMQALATGGGLTARGTEKGVRLHRKGPDGKLQVLQSSMDITLHDGDVVYVRESLF